MRKVKKQLTFSNKHYIINPTKKFDWGYNDE